MVSNVFDSWLGNLRRNQEFVAKHELFVETESVLILREFIPHRSEDRGTFFCCMLEGCVEVVSLGISLVNCVPDDLLNSGRSEPGFTIQQ